MQTIKRLLVLLLAASLTSCTANHSRANISRAAQNGREQINLEIWRATDHWVFGHGGFGNVIEYYGFALRQMPAGRTSLGISEFTLLTAESESGIVASPTAGTIIIDMPASSLRVALKTPSGDFPGNGIYSMNR